MHYFAVAGIFKNEGHALREWVEHYFHHGAEHIYLIDDASTDDGADTIHDYVKSGKITLFHEKDHARYLGRQSFLYNRYILPHIHQTHWLLIADLDEFIWSPKSVDLRPVLAEMYRIGMVQVVNTVFGSNGHIQTPVGIVKSYTRRSSEHPTLDPGQIKYFINSSLVDVYDLNVHYSKFNVKQGNSVPYYIIGEKWFVLNHYGCQSLQFWRDVKCTRGSANNYKVDTLDRFALWDRNDIEDTRLLEQNRPIIL